MGSVIEDSNKKAMRGGAAWLRCWLRFPERLGFAPCGGITRIRSKGFPAVCGISASLRQRPCDVLGVWGIRGGKSRGVRVRSYGLGMRRNSTRRHRDAEARRYFGIVAR